MVERIKRKINRALSLILTVALLMGAMPYHAIRSSAKEESGSGQAHYYYNLHKINEWRGIGEPNTGIYADSSGRKRATPIENVTSFDMTTKGNESELYPDSTIETDPWYFIAKDTTATTIAYSDYLYGMYVGPNTGWLTLGIRVGESGTYNVYSEDWQWANGGIVDIYIAPIADKDNVRDEKYLVGTVDTYSSQPIYGSLQKAGQVELEAGDYAVSFVLNGKNSAVSAAAPYCFNGLVLDTAEDTSADAPVITSSEGGRFLESTKVTITGQDKYTKIFYTTDGSEPGFLYAGVLPAGTSGVYSGEFEIADTTTVKAVAWKGGMAASAVTTTVLEKGEPIQPRYYYNLHKINTWRGIGEPNTGDYQWSSGRKKATPIEEITSFDKTTAGNESEIYPESTAQTDPWYFIERDSAITTFGYADYLYGIYVGPNNGSVTLGIRVGEDATYNVYSEHWQWTGGGSVDIYIAPLTDKENIRDTKYHVGQINTKASANTFAVLQKAGQVSLKQGDYAVCYVNTGVYAFNGLVLDAVEDRAADAPVIMSSEGNSFTGSTTISMTAQDAYTKIYYTTDGTEPGVINAGVTPQGTSKLYTGEFEITDTTTVKAIVWKGGMKISDVTTAVFESAGPVAVDAPVIDPAGGAVTDKQKISITTATPDAAIYYTTNGKDPTESSTEYTGPFSITEDCTVKAIAVKSGMKNSDVTSAAFTKTEEVENPRYYYNLHKINEWRGLGEPTNGVYADSTGKKRAKPIEEISSFAMTTKGSPTEIFPDSTAATDPWYFIARDTAASFCLYNDYIYGMFLGYNTGWLTLGVRVGQSGTYNIYSENFQYASGAIVDVYIAPMADKDNVRDEKYLVGKVDTYGSTNYGVIQKVGQKSLDAGDYAVCLVLNGKNSSSGASAGYGFNGLIFDTLEDTAAAAPVIASSGGENFVERTNVSISAQDKYTKIFYTTDGSEPGFLYAGVLPAGTSKVYTAGFEITDTTTIKAIAYKGGMQASPVATANLTLDTGGLETVAAPTFDPAGGTVDETQEISITSATPDAKIYYTTDGSDPTASSKEYIAPFTVTEDCTIKAIALKTGMYKSDIASARFVYKSSQQRDFCYNMFKLSTWWANGANPNDWNDRHRGLDVTAITNFEQTTEGSPNEVHPGSAARTDPWYCVGTTAAMHVFSTNNAGLYVGTETGNVQLMIKVKNGGVYQPSVEYFAPPYGAQVRAYLAPESDLEHAMDAKYSIGFIDSYSDPVAIAKIAKMKPVELAAGNYVLSFDIIGKNENVKAASVWWLGKFLLTGIDEKPEFTLSFDALPELNPGVSETLPLLATAADELTDDLWYADIEVSSQDPGIATAEVSANEKNTGRNLTIHTLKPGTTTIHVVAKDGDSVICTADIPVTVKVPVLDTLKLNLPRTIMNPLEEGLQIELEARDPDGNLLGVSFDQCTLRCEPEGIVSISDSGFVTPVSEGTATISATAFLYGRTASASIDITVKNIKSKSTYYTEGKVQSARDNIEKYSWARAMRDTWTQKADKYVGEEEFLWNLVTTQELPRGAGVGYRNDPNIYTCRYCNKELLSQYGYYPWLFNVRENPFKLQCPDCRRYFPSNDFEGFYKLGIDEHGNWSYELAKEKNAELVASGKDGYLKNVLYPEKGEGWGVDDGYGYRTGKMITGADGVEQEETHTYIGYYNHWGVWYSSGEINQALNALLMAYLYTGDVRYGRPGAILVDRIADVYADMDLRPYQLRFFNSDFGAPGGKIVGRIWEPGLATNIAKAYDGFYPMYEDPKVISFLSEKAEKYQMENTKDDAALIRQNSEENVLMEIFKAAKSCDIFGNFGMHQSAVIYAGVILDRMPETKEMIDWVFQSGGRIGYDKVTGGNVEAELISTIGRDGEGTEASPQYNELWVNQMVTLSDALAGYDGYEGADIYSNPKFVKMFMANIPLTLVGRYTAQIGDTGSVDSMDRKLTLSHFLKAYIYTKEPKFAQLVYFLCDGDLEKAGEGEIFLPNIDQARREIREVIEEYGEYDFGKSDMLASYGFAALRGGSYQDTAVTGNIRDTQRDFWMYFGRGQGHGHPDALNIGIDAYGFNLAPEFGYPEVTTGADKTVNWSDATVTHNTVMVNNASQYPVSAMGGKPQHFDDSGRVKVMDVDVPNAYSGITSTYRRTMVMIDANDDVSYGVDFFRIKGGSDHTYVFHAMSDEITEISGLELTDQKDASGNWTGSYAGPDVPYETPGVKNGYSYLKNVRRASAVENGAFSLDFKIKDFKDNMIVPMDLHLRMTMLNGFKLSEVALAKGAPPQVYNNPKEIDFVLAKRTGSDLNTLFTTVFEPYKDERYISSMEEVSVKRADNSDMSGDTVKAVKVTLTNGRVDYIVYAGDNTITYRVDDVFDFCGFIGVYTMQDGECAYSYMNDGTQIGGMSGTDAYTGKVVSFTKDIAFENEIEVSFDGEVDAEQLVGKYIYIKNDGAMNAVYPIVAVSTTDGQTYKLSTGDITLVRSLKDANDTSKGYIYNIAEGQTFRIPLPTLNDTSPVIAPVPDQTVEAGSELKFQIVAESPSGRELAYTGKDLPRGANFDAASKTFSWIPDSSQIGKNHAAIVVSDGILESTIHVNITVYNSASGGGTSSINKQPGSTSTDKPVEPNPPVVTTEKDEVNFAASADETTAETKLGSVTFADGTFAADGQGKLKIEREGETYTVSVTATVDMAEQPAKVSLAYTPADNMADENCIIVKDENGNIIPNGRYENGKMTFYTESFGKFTIEYNPKSFTDLGNHAWASEAVTRLAARGIINGITATTYGPSKNITRADFTTLIVRAFGFTAETASFADVPANAYYAEPVGIAKTLGIVGGVNETDFAPTSEITRQDMMVIVARALEKAGYVLDATENAEFSDIDEVADYAKDAVEILTRSGLIAGSNGKINPKGNTTRAEVAVILDRIVFMTKQ